MIPAQLFAAMFVTVIGFGARLRERWCSVCALVLTVLMLITCQISTAYAASLSGAHSNIHSAVEAPLDRQFLLVELLDYQLAAQPLSSSLTEFAEASDLQILYRTDLLPKLEAPAVNGYFSRRQALEQLLSETGLTFTFGGRHAVVIHSHQPGLLTSVKRSPQGPTSVEPPVLEETYVTGVRRALKANLAIKQNSSNVLDVVTSEDIGKFPDQNVADALQRIAGVSVDRLWGQGRDVNIRGTDKDINRTLLNGQHVASAYWWANDNPSRGFNYSTLASQLVQSLEVHKSPSAAMDEGSIGGTVNIRTREPFHLKSLETHIAYEQHYSDLAEAWGPQISALSSWKNPQQTLGILASINWQDHTSRRDGLETFSDNSLYDIIDEGGNITPNVYAIWGGGSAILQQSRTHATGNVTLQWVPVKNWELGFNSVRSEMVIDNLNHNFLFTVGGHKLREQSPAIVYNPTFVTADDGNHLLLGGTLVNANSTGALLDIIERDAYIKTLVNDFSADYQTYDRELHIQLGNTRAIGGTKHDWMYRFAGDTRSRFALNERAIDIAFLDLDPLSSADMGRFSSVSRDWIRRMENNENYAQLDVTQRVNRGPISTIEFGSKLRDHFIENHRTVGALDEAHPAWSQLNNTSLEQVGGGVTPRLHQQAATPTSLTRYAWANPAKLDTIVKPLFDAGVMTYRDDRSAYYRIDEVSQAYYVMLNFEDDTASGNSWSGNIGIRYVGTRQSAAAYDGDKIQSTESRYHDYLPSMNVAYSLRPDLIVRGAAARVMARPNYQNLSANVVTDPTSGAISTGNPLLAPYKANQFDLGVEWYFAEASLLSANLFHKSISTFIYPETSMEPINGELQPVTRPQNSAGANITGMELQWQRDFSSGFGLLGNYTFTGATVPSPDGTRSFELPGNSESQFNASLFYEGTRLSGRISYNYRSRSYGDFIAGSQSVTAAYQQWDANLQWRVSRFASVVLKGINLNNEVIYIHSRSGVPQGIYENGRRFIVGLRLDF